ncbi:hypothetical protein P171DRAFT_485271 [Karstenula rhodostoma CBS 690.94]|uniref:Uncharacterized protein n=1 Tax=Karstenula rhodostoma CBS 690.94 TaxID=1392251 RepID=A0A9P4UDI7_9PLEO|nr:hypothetical protein P171DRAFT_485271 [Karstenula rhodostoma CBS 690.94]
MKTDMNEFNNYIKKLGNHMDQTCQRLGPNPTPEQNRLYSDIDYTTDRIIEARTGDQGYYLLRKARTDLEIDGLTVRVQQLNGGVNPAQAINPTLHAWETVDWGETIKQRPSDMTLDTAQKYVKKIQQ